MKSRLKSVLVGAGLMGLVGASVVGYGWNRVIRVSDGDTFVLGNRQEVRLLGIDAPERDMCGASEAKEELEK
ncbi:hypothetical protein HYV64_05630 [Candidatus Shapirobacteria bacterium]|nr:hypothetical protein [Candidatus Shapirobacteria bacterium]